MIKIEKIEISNYRSFKDKSSITNLSDINIMVGKNNVGKTNLLRAIYLFFNPHMYDSTIDRNYIKQLTRGRSSEPKIVLTFRDNELIRSRETRYSISCNLNQNKSNIYQVTSRIKEVNDKFNKSSKIENYLKNKFKCVFLSTTDEDIDAQSKRLLNDLILRYYKKRNGEVQQSISDFEKSYKRLQETFRDNIVEIESDLSTQFETLTSVHVIPKLEQTLDKDITSFLIENINLRLDDAYSQKIGVKGAGVQRASLLLLTMYLLNQIFTRENKLILLDEPEAFLYPLLEKELKEKLEENVINQEKMQLFMTSHSRTYLEEINNPEYTFSYFLQKQEPKSYVRSKNETDINKYTVIEAMDRKNKYEVLKNYGLLEDVNDYEYVIICEGETDSNYIKKILEDKEFIPQIRFDKYQIVSNVKSVDLQHSYVGKGAMSALPILAYLDRVSQVQRKVLVLLDGDEEGQNAFRKIIETEYTNLDILKLQLPQNKEIEDVVFSKEMFINRVLSNCPAFEQYKDSFTEVIKRVPSDQSMIKQTELFITGNQIDNANIYKIKSLISQNLNDVELEKDYLLSEFNSFFYTE